MTGFLAPPSPRGATGDNDKDRFDDISNRETLFDEDVPDDYRMMLSRLETPLRPTPQLTPQSGGDSSSHTAATDSADSPTSNHCATVVAPEATPDAVDGAPSSTVDGNSATARPVTPVIIVEDQHSKLPLPLPQRTMRPRRSTVNGVEVDSAVRGGKPHADSPAPAIARNSRQRRADYHDKVTELEQHFHEDETYAQYLRFYRPVCLKYWRWIDVGLSGMALLFTLFSSLTVVARVNSSQQPAGSSPLSTEAALQSGADDSGRLNGIISSGSLLVAVPLLHLIGTFTVPEFRGAQGLRYHLGSMLAFGWGMCVFEGFSESPAPLLIQYPFYLALYTSLCQPTRWAIFIGVTTSILDLLALLIRYGVSLQPPNFSTGCQIESGDHSGCTGKIFANILLYICVHVFGIYSVIVSERYTKKIYIKHRETQKERALHQQAREEAERIAKSILPVRVWDDLNAGSTGNTKALDKMLNSRDLLYDFSNVTMIYGDVVGFTATAAHISASELVTLLDTIFTQFDELMTVYGLEKIKTIGDCYMCCTGIPWATQMAELKAVTVGREMTKIVERISQASGHNLKMRIGIHSGAAKAGILGEEKIIFDLWSDDVNIASLMEQTGRPSMVHISAAVKKELEGMCTFQDGPTVEFKGQKLDTYFVNEVLSSVPEDKTITSLQRSLVNNRFSKTSMSRKRRSDLVMRSGYLEKTADDDGDSGELNETRISKLFGRFTDADLEEEYQASCVGKSTGKVIYNFFVTMVMNFLLMLLDIAMFSGRSETYLLAGLLLLIQASLFILVISKWRAYRIHDQHFKKMLFYLSSQINYQYLGPFVVVSLYLVTLAQLSDTMALAHCLLYHSHAVCVILLIPVVFRRFSSIYMSLSAVIIALAYYIAIPVRFLVIEGLEWSQFSTLFGSTVIVTLFMTMATAQITAYTEYMARKNYYQKKDMTLKKFELDDMRVRTEKLLYKLLPRMVITRLKEKPDNIIADDIACASVLFCHFRGVETTETKTLNDLITQLDNSLKLFDVEKIKSIGTMYLVTAWDGIDRENSSKHLNTLLATLDDDEVIGSSRDESFCARISDFAIHALRTVEKYNASHDTNVQISMGIDCGPLVAGVIGKKKFAYDVWGDTVNTASRMESTGQPAAIQCTERAFQLMKNEFAFKERGMVPVKGKGEMKTYFLLGRRVLMLADPSNRRSYSRRSITLSGK